MRILGLVNVNHNNEVYINDLLDNGINHYNYNNFMGRCKNILERIFNSSLENLMRRKLINFDKQTVIIPCSGDNFIANQEEEKLIKDIEKSVLLEMGYDNIGVIILKGLKKKYYNEVSSRLVKEYKWYRYFIQYEIKLLNNELIDSFFEHEIKDLRQELNNKVIEAINSNAEMEFNKYPEWKEIYNSDNTWVYVLEYQEKTGEEGLPYKEPPFKYHDDYVEMQKELSDKLLRINLTD